MPPDTFSPSLPTTPTQSWTQDSTLDDVQQEQQSEEPEGVIVFEKKWIVTEVEDDSASYFLSSTFSSPETRQAVSFTADTRPTSVTNSLSNDAIAAFQFQDGLDKNGIFFDHNIDSSSETTAGAYRTPHLKCRVAEPHHISYVPPPRLTEWEDESPYPEVRAAVSNTDDMEMPADTFRSWMIGLLWAFLIPGLNQFFHFRYPSVTIGSVRRPFPPHERWIVGSSLT